MLLIVEIDPKEQKVYIGRENGSGAEYSANSSNDVGAALKFYLDTYYTNIFENTGGNE